MLFVVCCLLFANLLFSFGFFHVFHVDIVVVVIPFVVVAFVSRSLEYDCPRYTVAPLGPFGARSVE